MYINTSLFIHIEFLKFFDLSPFPFLIGHKMQRSKLDPKSLEILYHFMWSFPSCVKLDFKTRHKKLLWCISRLFRSLIAQLILIILHWPKLQTISSLYQTIINQKLKIWLLIFSLLVFMSENLDGNNYFEKFVFVHAALINPAM